MASVDSCNVVTIFRSYPAIAQRCMQRVACVRCFLFLLLEAISTSYLCKAVVAVATTLDVASNNNKGSRHT